MKPYSFRQKIAFWYVVIFYALLIFKWSNDMLLYQQQPSFIYNTFDIFSWMFLQTRIPHWLLQTKHFLLFDMIYYTAPLLLLLSAHFKPKLIPHDALYILIVNWIYLQSYFLYPISSYTIFIAWLLFPIIFLANGDKTFVLLFDGVRYFFLYFFLSAGIWKIRIGGVFNPEQLSAILLEQHKEMLTNSPGYWLSQFYHWLIQHTTFSYVLYVMVTFMELSFITGFFTKRYDKFLILIYFIFLFADYFVMRIPYFETLPFLLTLYFHPVNVPVHNSSFFSKSVNLRNYNKSK